MEALNIFLICPVRNSNEEISKKIGEYVSEQEKLGNTVHWPERDTEQVDPSGGINICLTNCQAIKDADRVDVWWDPDSKGSLFDLGVAMAFDKIINIVNVVTPTEEKSFTNVLISMADYY